MNGEQYSFLVTDNLGNTTISAMFRVNKRERPMLRTATETRQPPKRGTK